MWEWREYVPVAQRRAQAKRHAERLAKKEGRKTQPIEIAGRKIAKTFWGEAWCDNLESYSDFANRLPRGRTYARNGSVADLQIAKGTVTAIVGGSDVYEVTVKIARVPAPNWKKIVADCSQSIDSLMDLLQGRLSQGVMERLTRQKEGLFPRPKDISMGCTCPDYATLCKHVAAVLYGVGARLDSEPELLFLLRQVDHLELIGRAFEDSNLETALGAGESDTLADEDLGALFGIELDGESEPSGSKKTPARQKRAAKSSSSRKGTADKKASTKKKTSAKKASLKKRSSPKAPAKKAKKTTANSARTKATGTKATGTKATRAKAAGAKAIRKEAAAPRSGKKASRKGVAARTTNASLDT